MSSSAYSALVPTTTPVQVTAASSLRRILDGGRVESRVFVSLAIGLVLLRAATFLLVEGMTFDSDEALYGLMAKHISELRAFPIFSYGEGYQMAVEAWLIAPFFRLFGPSVLMMKIPLLLLNIAVTVTLMRMLTSALKIRPAFAFLAMLPFIMPTPVVAGSLMENSGSATEPLLYIPALWVLRRKPFAFGAVLMFGFLHREFTLYALPAMLVVGAFGRRWLTQETLQRLAWTAAGSAAVWVVIDQFRRLSVEKSAIEQAQMLMNHTCFAPAEWPARFAYAATNVVPIFSSGVSTPFYDFSLRSAVVTGGFGWMGWLVAGAMLMMLGRVLWTGRLTALAGNYGLFLVLVGGCAIAAYPLGCNLEVGAPPVLRYVHLLLFIPIGAFAAFIAREPSRHLRAAAIGVFVLWGSINLFDNARVIHTAYVSPEASPHRELADFLVGQDIQLARAGFWDAYAVSFLSGEQVIVESAGPARIPAYTRLVDDAGHAVADIVRMPCEGDIRVAGAWCVQVPDMADGGGQ